MNRFNLYVFIFLPLIFITSCQLESIEVSQTNTNDSGPNPASELSVSTPSSILSVSEMLTVDSVIPGSNFEVKSDPQRSITWEVQPNIFSFNGKGELVLNSPLDFESASELDLNIKISDGVDTWSGVQKISVFNVYEEPQLSISTTPVMFIESLVGFEMLLNLDLNLDATVDTLNRPDIQLDSEYFELHQKPEGYFLEISKSLNGTSHSELNLNFSIADGFSTVHRKIPLRLESQPSNTVSIHLNEEVFIGPLSGGKFLTEVNISGESSIGSDLRTLSGPDSGFFQWLDSGLYVAPGANLLPGLYSLSLNIGSTGPESAFYIDVVNADQVSQTWGLKGESWSPESRLPWFGHSGYHFGDDPLPVNKIQTHSVLDFGATANDDVDDSEAFSAAINAASNGVLYIPEGEYTITRILSISTANTVIRGAGPGKTILNFPLNLEQTTGSSSGTYTYRGGFLDIRGQRKIIGNYSLAEPTNRGSTKLVLTDIQSLKPGDSIVIQQPGNVELASHLHADHLKVDPEYDNQNARALTDWVAKIESIDGNTLTMDRPTRYDIKPEWVSIIGKWEDPVQEIGIESMTFKMANQNYAGHNKERGNNAIQVSNIANSWIYDVEILDADNAIKVSNSRFLTLKDIHLSSKYRTSTHGSPWHLVRSQQSGKCCRGARYINKVHS